MAPCSAAWDWRTWTRSPSWPPAGMRDQERRQRPAHGAGEPAPQRQARDRRPRRRAVEPAECRERWVVQPAAHSEAQEQPAGQVDRQRRRERQRGQPGRKQQGCQRQHRATAVAVDRGADMRRGERGDQQAEGQATDHPGERPAGAVRDRAGEHRRQVERRPPGEDLHHAEGGDHRPAASLGHGPPTRCRAAVARPPAPAA